MQSGFLEILVKDGVDQIDGAPRFEFRLDEESVQASIESKELKRGMLQINYIYLALELGSFDTNIAEIFSQAIRNKDLVVYLKDIEEAIFMKDLLSEKASSISNCVRQLQK